jgi:fibronectin-binding autotransporter adhesin
MRNSNSTSTWERILNRLGFEPRRKRRKSKTLEPAKRRSLRLEPLEDRALLSVLTWDPDLSNNGVYGGSGNWTTANAWVDTSTNIRYTWNSSRANDQAVFKGNAGTVAVNASGIRGASLAFQDVDGYVISGANALTLTGGGVAIDADQSATINTNITATTANQQWSIASGKTLTIGGAVTFTNRTLTIQGDGGTARFASGGVVHTGASFRVSGGGTATFSAGGLTTYTTIVGSGSAGNLNWNSGGVLTASSRLYVGFGGTGTLTETAGAITTSTNDVEFNNASTFRLLGGATLKTSGINTYYQGNVPDGCWLNACGGHLQALANFPYAVDNGLSYFAESGDFIYFDTNGFNMTLAGNISGPGHVIKRQTGTLTLTGVGDYTGTTRCGGGTLVIGNPLTLQCSTLNLYSGDSGTFSFGALTNASLGGLAAQRNLNLQNAYGGAVALTVGGNYSDNAYSGVLSGSGSLVKTGFGTQTFTAVNTFTGGTTLITGTVCFNSGSLGTTGNITFGANSTLQWASGNTQDISSRLHMDGNDVRAVLDVGANAVTFASSLDDGGTVTKLGTGTLTLNGLANSTEAVYVDGGTLAVNGVLSAVSSTYGVQVNDGATLAGSGTILGTIFALSGGGILSPGGDNVGMLTVTDAAGYGLVLASSTSTFRVDINGNTPSDYDRISVNGPVWISGTLVVDGTYAPTPGSSITIIHNDGTDPVAGSFFTNGNSVLVGGVLMSILYSGGDGNDVVLTC